MKNSEVSFADGCLVMPENGPEEERLVRMVMAVGRKDAERRRALREALKEGDEEKALLLARQLVGLEQELKSA